MSLATAHDVPILIESENAASERRINLGWSIAQLKGKLEIITGIPVSSQKMTLFAPNSTTNGIAVTGSDEENTTLSGWRWEQYARLVIDDTRPPGARPNYTDSSQVEKYEMPEEEYSKLSDSVLAWKKRNQLGRFDPNKTQEEAEKQAKLDDAAKTLKVGSRCLVGGERRGEVAFIGSVKEIQNGQGGVWVGVRLDEPMGKNNGTIEGTRYFQAGEKCGVFVKPNRLEVGDFSVKTLEEEEDFMEEI